MLPARCLLPGGAQLGHPNTPYHGPAPAWGFASPANVGWWLRRSPGGCPCWGHPFCPRRPVPPGRGAATYPSLTSGEGVAIELAGPAPACACTLPVPAPCLPLWGLTAHPLAEGLSWHQATAWPSTEMQVNAWLARSPAAPWGEQEHIDPLSVWPCRAGSTWHRE